MRQEDHLPPRTMGDCGVRASRHCLWASLVAALVAWASTPAHAGFVVGSYKITIAETARLLEAILQEERGEISEAELDAVYLEESCKNPSIRLIHRNRPAMSIQNTSDPLNSENRISQFQIDLIEAGFGFGTGDFDPDPFAGQLTILSDRSDDGISIASSYGTVSDTDPTLDPSKLLLDITGLTPGKAFIFLVDLDPEPTALLQFPDYRRVMLGADPGTGPGKPALLSALFASGEGSNLMTTPTVPAEFDGGIENVFDIGGLLESYHGQTPTQTFMQTGQTIPEPSSLLLLLAGMAGLSGIRRSRCL